jgi:hypothetical protein
MTKLKIDNFSQEEINRLLSDAWLNINVKPEDLYNPLLNIPEFCSENPHHYFTWLMMQPEYFSFICSQILNINIYPMQSLLLREIWNHKFPMLIGARGLSKSFTAAIYILLRMLLMPGRKVIITGAAFRQSKIIFEYMENIWNNAPILQNLCGSGRSQGPVHGTDVWSFGIGSSIAKALPVGTGEKIRGARANDIWADEFHAIQREIFETVIAGFATVRSNPIEALKSIATDRLAKYLKIPLKAEDKIDDYTKDNQIVISGTAYYDFNHFCEYWKKWRSIVMSKGNKHELGKMFTNGVPEDFAWKDYCIFRIPVELVPSGFMDEGQLARSRATMDAGIYEMEFGSVFARDSNGFFKRSLIEGAIASPQNGIKSVSGQTIVFPAVLVGNNRAKYIIGIDPASEIDDFSISVLELHENHRRLVYCWTTNKKDFRERASAGLIKETEFYSFVARKIRELMKVFPCDLIAMDSQGGGHAVVEALHNINNLKLGELPIWPIIDSDNPSDTDREQGLHLVKLVNFADANWTSEANHNLKKDLGDKTLLFPFNDAIDIAIELGKRDGDEGLYDTLEDCLFEIEETKNELSTIIITKTNSGRDKWDTPDIKLPGAKKGRMRKDRYSSLLIANMEGRILQQLAPIPEYNFEIAWADSTKNNENQGPLFIGPAWVNDMFKDLYD